MISSSVLTLVNKYLYAKYHFKSPLNLLFMQCLCNVVICSSMIFWKTAVNKNSFESMRRYGIIIPTFSEATNVNKFKVGPAIAVMNLIGVLFGLYAAKFCNIPLLLTQGRCAILATIIVSICLLGKYPDRKVIISAFLIILGAIVAGYDSLDANALGFAYVWLNNFT